MMVQRKAASFLVALLLGICGALGAKADDTTLTQFLNILDPETRTESFQRFDRNWNPGLAAPLIEMASLFGDRDLDLRIFRLPTKKLD